METRRVVGADFRNVTIVHTEADIPWADYVKEKFKPDQLNLKISTVNLTSLDSDNPTEIEIAIDQSYVVVLLTTCYLLEYMEKNYEWLVPILYNTDKTITTIVTARLDVALEDLNDVIDKHKYNQSSQWEQLEINVDGTNIMQCVADILDFSDRNIQAHDRLLLARTNSHPGKLSSFDAKESFEIIPSTIHRDGEKVALIFAKEKPKGAVILYAKGINIPVETINPYCVTFKAPAITGTKIYISVEVNNFKYPRFKLFNGSQTPQFSSVELMCQSYGVTKKEELDKQLAEKFTSTICDDREAVRIFSNMVKNTSIGKRDSQFPTLLHWAAANGLKELCSALLSAPGAYEACDISNSEDDDVADLALKNGHLDLASLITEFTETKEMADVCDFYVKSCRSIPASDSIYEIMTDVQPGRPPPIVPRTPQTVKDPQLSSCPDPSSEEEDNYIVPDDYPLPTAQDFWSAKIELQLPGGAIGSRSQTELIEIQEEVKMGNFSIHEAEMLFKSWKSRYETGNAISFRERQQSLFALREQYKKTMDVLKAAKCKGKEKGKKSIEEISEMAAIISEPIGMRLKTTTKMAQPAGQERGDSWRSTGRANHDSGRFSGRESTLSQASTSSEETEFEDDRHLLRTNRSQSEKATGRLTDYRQSVRDQYLELTHDLPELPEAGPPPLPPRLNRHTPAAVKQPPRVALKPSFNKMPKLPVPSKSSKVFIKQ